MSARAELAACHVGVGAPNEQPEAPVSARADTGALLKKPKHGMLDGCVDDAALDVMTLASPRCPVACLEETGQVAGAGLCTVWPAPSVKGLVRMGSYVASESKTASSCAGSSSKVEAVTLLSEPAEDVLRCPLTGRWRVGAWHQSVDAPRVSCWASMRSAAAAISAIAARCDGTRMRARMSVMVPAEPVRSIDPVREGIRRCKAEHEEWAPAPASDVESSFESSSMLRHESSPGGSEGAALVPISESLAVQKHSAVRTALHGFRRRGPKSNSELERDKFFRTLVPAEVGIILPAEPPVFRGPDWNVCCDSFGTKGLGIPHRPAHELIWSTGRFV